jgi:hypothetical protein
MTTTKKVVPLRPDITEPPPLPEPRLRVSHLIRPKPAPASSGGKLVDLRGKRRVLLIVGAGGSGKTTFLRWACERELDRPDRNGDFTVATADALNRDLCEYFAGVMEAPSIGAVDWLAQVMFGMPGSGAINFGGEDTSLARLAQEIPDLAGTLSEHGIEPVLLVFLKPRIADLTTLQVLDESGFQPVATALVTNLGTVTSLNAVDPFADVVGHSIFQAAMARGAAHVWMPRLHGAGPRIERARVSFAKALDGTGDAPVLDMLGRIRLKAWLAEMDVAFGGLEGAGWLP